MKRKKQRQPEVVIPHEGIGRRAMQGKTIVGYLEGDTFSPGDFYRLSSKLVNFRFNFKGKASIGFPIRVRAINLRTALMVLATAYNLKARGLVCHKEVPMAIRPSTILRIQARMEMKQP